MVTAGMDAIRRQESFTRVLAQLPQNMHADARALHADVASRTSILKVGQRQRDCSRILLGSAEYFSRIVFWILRFEQTRRLRLLKF